MKADFSLEACMESVKMEIELCHEDPIRLLGEFTLRAEQDLFFNKTMIDALKLYISEHGIKWNDGVGIERIENVVADMAYLFGWYIGKDKFDWEKSESVPDLAPLRKYLHQWAVEFVEGNDEGLSIDDFFDGKMNEIGWKLKTERGI